MSFSKNVITLSAVSLIAGCAYVDKSSHQDITFLTPGAMNAFCYVYVDKIKYKVYPPQLINIKKHHEDMNIQCTAPGNRMVEMDVSSKIYEKAVWGTPVGMAWDYASQSLYSYPSVIAIDFSHEVVTTNALPQHNNPDIIQPEQYDLEEIDSAQPLLNSDKNKVDLPILKRGEDYTEEQKTGASVDVHEGAIDDVIDNLSNTSDVIQETNVADTSRMEVEDAVSEPVQIYPGQ